MVTVLETTKLFHKFLSLKKIDYSSTTTLGALKKSGYVSRSIKQEMRENLIEKIQKKERVFEGIIGYDTTVIPDVQRALLSKHNMILLGLRGQAKTRLARMMTNLLDEYVPVIEGNALNDDPLDPISVEGIELIKEMGDETPVAWWHRSDRYSEKLATPDVSVADLIGDVDPIKAANLRLSYSDERVIHFGIIPRSHRSIFVINELPDLQARIQVSLFNILQEGDIQIRGFKLRLPLDIQFVFTANPEDYTNRGSIVTPLKDRIESQILTHYPKTVAESMEITRQEAKQTKGQFEKIAINEVTELLLENVAFEARESEFVDRNSGVSARLTITARENLVSAAELRCLNSGEKKTHVRLCDLWGIVPAITGKIELVYEGEQEGPLHVAHNLINKSIRVVFAEHFPDPSQFKKQKIESPYQPVIDWFAQNETFDLPNGLSNKEYGAALKSIPHLAKLVSTYQPQAKGEEQLFLMEFLLHGLAEYSMLGKEVVVDGFGFKDLFNMFNPLANLGGDQDFEE